MIKPNYAYFLLFIISFLSYGQTGVVNELNDLHKKTIDSLTNHWNTTNKPGGAIAIIHNNRLVYQNALGQANLETSKKNTTQTLFQLAQLSDSFLAYGLLSLEQKGKLSLEDKLYTHLPYIKKLSKNITVKNLLEHSSGIHDFEVLKNIVGWKENERFSIKDVLQIIRSQKQPSFTPGMDFSYSRTNMVLISEVISKVSKMNFSDYLKQHVFIPLGMENTYVLNRTNQKNQRIATSYSVNEKNIVPIKSKKETYASINILSSIEDLSKWELHFMNPTNKTQDVIQKFNTFVKLNNGKEFNIPSGKLTYGQRYVHKERGIDTSMIIGGIDGFAAAIFQFPNQTFTVITLSNNGESYNGYIGMLSAHSIIKGSFVEPNSIDFSKIKIQNLIPNYHKKYEGMYWDALGELSREINIKNDTLRYVRPNGHSTILLPLSKDRFQMKTNFDDKIYLTFKEHNGKITMQYTIGEATPFEFVKYRPKESIKSNLTPKFSGNYYCKELGIGYQLSAQENNLIASNIRTDSIHFTPIMDNIFSGDKWYLGSIEFELNDQGNIDGFFVRNNAIRNLWFQRLTF